MTIAEADAAVDRELAAFRASLGPRLGSAFDQLAARLGLGEGRAPFSSYFRHALSLPVLDLPRWVALAAGRACTAVPEERVLALSLSGAMGYLHVRVQDDLLDEGEGEPGDAMLLAEALHVRHVGLTASAVGGSSRFWTLFEERWRAYGEAMLLEARLLRGTGPYGRTDFEAVLDRSMPLLLPPAGVVELADRWAWLPELEALVRSLVLSHQLFHDLLHIEKDLAASALTHVARRLGAEHGLEAMRRRTYLEGGFDEIVAEAAAALGRAGEAARRLGLTEAEDALEARRGTMARLQREAFAALFERALATGSTAT